MQVVSVQIDIIQLELAQAYFDGTLDIFVITHTCLGRDKKLFSWDTGFFDCCAKLALCLVHCIYNVSPGSIISQFIPRVPNLPSAPSRCV